MERTGHEPERTIKSQVQVEHGDAHVDFIGTGRSSDLCAFLDDHLNAIGRSFFRSTYFLHACLGLRGLGPKGPGAPAIFNLLKGHRDASDLSGG